MPAIKLTAKPDTIDAYTKWMSDNPDITFDSRTKMHYESVVNKCHADISESTFWRQFAAKLTEFDQQYTVETTYPLLQSTAPPEILKKPYDSFLDKTYRKNVINNRNWPSPPSDGWLQPIQWFSRVGDVIRTSIVAKYLDGVDFLVDHLTKLAEQCDLKHKTHFESRDEGYYAAHFYAYYDLSIPTLDFDSEQVSVALEVQVRTQLQDVIRTLLHSYYQERRSTKKNDERTWQWRYRDEEFSVNYLGHILHYLEGQIVEIREKRNGN